PSWSASPPAARHRPRTRCSTGCSSGRCCGISPARRRLWTSCGPGRGSCCACWSGRTETMATHRAVHVGSAGGPLELVEVDTAPPGPRHVRLDVSACGVCGTDHAFVNGLFPGLNWPITPGHEIAGTVAEIGPDVEQVEIGERVVVGWFGGNCGHCARCRAGQLIHCLYG